MAVPLVQHGVEVAGLVVVLEDCDGDQVEQRDISLRCWFGLSE